MKRNNIYVFFLDLDFIIYLISNYGTPKASIENKRSPTERILIKCKYFSVRPQDESHFEYTHYLLAASTTFSGMAR